MPIVQSDIVACDLANEKATRRMSVAETPSSVLDLLGRVRLQELAERCLIDVLVAVAEADVLVDEGLIVKALLEDDLGHRVEQQQVGARDDRQMDVGVLGGLGSPRIDADDRRLRVQPLALPDALEDRRVALERVGADQEEDVGVVGIVIAARRLVLAVGLRCSRRPRTPCTAAGCRRRCWCRCRP